MVKLAQLCTDVVVLPSLGAVRLCEVQGCAAASKVIRIIQDKKKVDRIATLREALRACREAPGWGVNLQYDTLFGMSPNGVLSRVWWSSEEGLRRAVYAQDLIGGCNHDFFKGYCAVPFRKLFVVKCAT